MPSGVIETGAVVETMPSSGSGFETGTRQIEIKETTPAAPVTPAKPPMRARDRMFSNLEKKATITAPDTETPTGTKPETPPSKAQDGAEPSPEPEKVAAGDQTAPVPGEKPAKQSPWKIVESYKETNKKLQKEIADLRASIAPEKDIQALNKRLEERETALKEKEEFIRLHRYEQSEEYRDKYEKPWLQTWQKVAKKMSEISVADPTSGGERPATVNDMQLIVNAPLGQARKMAEELFGSFANDAMAMREKIIELYEAKTEAIESAKKEGTERERQEAQKQQQMATQMRETFTKEWAKANEDVLTNKKYGQYFKPREGDPEWNKRLERGTALVDKALAAMRPHITDPAQLAEIVKLHAVVRHRAIAFGPLRHENEALRKDRDSWKAKYEEIAKSTPPAGQGAQRGVSAGQPLKARDRLNAALDKIAVHG